MKINLLNQQPTNNSAIKIPSPILSSKEVTNLTNQTDWFPYSTINCSFSYNEKLKSKIDQIKRLAEKHKLKMGQK